MDSLRIMLNAIAPVMFLYDAEMSSREGCLSAFSDSVYCKEQPKCV